MRTLWRYVLKRYLLSLTSILVILLLLVLLVETMLDVDQIFEPGSGFTFILLKILSTYLLQYLLPAAAFFGAFISLGTAARDREILALKAGGVSPVTAVLPILAVAALLAGTSYWLSDTVVVTASQAFNERNQAGGGVLAVRRGTFWYHKGRYVYNFADRDPAGGTVHDVIVFERDDRNRLVRRIAADSATVEAGRRWHFHDATSHRFDPDLPGSAPQVERGAEITLELDEQPSAALLKREVAALSIDDLRNHVALRELRGRDVTRASALLQTRYSEPAGILLFALLALPLGLAVEQTRSMARGALQAVLALFAYYTLRRFASTLATEGILPAIAPWTIVLIFAFYGALRLARTSR